MSIKKPLVIDEMPVIVERSTEDSEQLDLFSKGKLLAYITVEDSSLNICPIGIELSKQDIKNIKSLCEDYLTQEIIDAEIQADYDLKYNISDADDQK